MPVVVATEKKDDNWVVVDGFHRTTACKNIPDIKESLKGYLPVSYLNQTIENRVASTVRHNMARGTHQVELSAKLVAFLKRNDWTNHRIGEELGMDPDEVLRLKQITGLAEAFQDKEFSRSWEAR
jgi:ParB-like chromosome segregation protein Spo0J